MKKAIFSLVAIAAATVATAQIKAPQPSPSAMFKQTVGLTEVSVEYSRPAKRDREIFGNLVPFDKLWRTGANANTIISFTDDIIFNGTNVKEGSYALYTKPGVTSWEVILYADTNNWGTPREWDDSKVMASTRVASQKSTNVIESFTIEVSHISMNAAHLQIKWDDTMVAIPFTVPTEEKTQASIDQIMAGPGANDYYQAASFYLDLNKDLEKAHGWIKKAVEMRPEAFWMVRKQSLIEAAMGDKKAAIKTAKKSLALSEKAGNADYVKMNKDSLREWGAM